MRGAFLTCSLAMISLLLAFFGALADVGDSTSSLCGCTRQHQRP
jgi:hypothetical protein